MSTSFWYSDRVHEKWTVTRRDGPLHFIFIRGLLLWGGMMFCVFYFIFPHMIHRPETDPPADPAPNRLPTQLLLWAFAGLLYGVLTWYYNEHFHEKYLEEHRPASRIVRP